MTMAKEKQSHASLERVHAPVGGHFDASTLPALRAFKRNRSAWRGRGPRPDSREVGGRGGVLTLLAEMARWRASSASETKSDAGSSP